jgi:predicted dehydrogenase
VPTFLCGECIQLAAKDHISIFKQAPLGRTLSEACSWVELAKKAGCRFHVGAHKRFSPGYLGAYALLQQQKIGRVYLVRAESFFNYNNDFGWRGDPVLAGGGVLLESAYHMIDQITWNMGSPEKVYCLHTNYCNKRVLPPYRTEDTAVVTMHFPNGAMGNLACGWMAGPKREKLTFYGSEGQIQVDENHLQVFDPSGKRIMREKFDIDEKWLSEQQICQLADSIRNPDLKPVSTAQEHLFNVALIEAAYLSGQTGLPESPKLHGGLLDIE